MRKFQTGACKVSRDCCVIDMGNGRVVDNRYIHFNNKSERQAVIKALQDFDRKKKGVK